MSYDLIITRLGAVADGPVLPVRAAIADEPELVSKFRAQTEALSRLVGESDERALPTANERLLSALRGAASEFADIELHPDDPIYPNRPDIFGIPFPTQEGEERDASKPKFESLVGLLPYRKVRVVLDGVAWVVRTRASMTSCSLQTGPRQTKLWWSVEGIPLTEGPLGEQHAAKFARLSESMSEDGMDPLRVAYVASLKEVTSAPAQYDFAKKGVQISMTDNDDVPVAELLDALYFRKTALSVIEDKDRKEFEPAREGLFELRRFINDAIEPKIKFKPKTVEVNDKVPNVKGILCRQDDLPTRATLIAGFARRAGGSGGYFTQPEPWDPGQRERYVRSISPARQLSGLLANQAGRDLEQHLGLH